jgi:hypothetical protein
MRPLSLLLPLVLLAGCSTAGQFHEPLPNASHRATPLHFGMHVTPDPAENPIDPPERFIGWHVATDYEVSAGELDGDVPVYAICDGEIVYSGFASGYGGLIAERCWRGDQAITVIYGHLALDSLAELGDKVEAGDSIALLGAARSHDTDGNRKHLHLGIRKGASTDFRGYVETEDEIGDFIDPATVLPQKIVDLPGQSPGETPYWQTGTGSTASSAQ